MSENKVFAYSTVPLQFNSPLHYTPEIKQFRNISLGNFIEHSRKSIPHQHNHAYVTSAVLYFDPKEQVFKVFNLKYLNYKIHTFIMHMFHFVGHILVCIVLNFTFDKNKRPRGLEALLGHLLVRNKLGLYAYQPSSYYLCS